MKVVAGVIDAGYHQNGCAPIIVQARLEAKVFNDTGDDALLAFAGAHQLLYGGPALAQDSALEIIQPLSFLLEPRIDSLLRRKALRHIAGLVFQVKDYLV